MLDRLIAFFVIIVLLPLLLVLLFVTVVDTRCNPIFIQKRTVYGDVVFNFYKIRSMKKNAPNVPTGEFLNSELYISPWGKFIRIYSLDELLNLICIIKGDMKFIGPRPIMICENELIDLRRRNGIYCLPGVTGLAQINGRDMISMKKKIACERYYNRSKSSTSLRIYILFKTLIIVFRKTGISH
jgi:O-antigen biosynthesis protein WbqP